MFNKALDFICFTIIFFVALFLGYFLVESIIKDPKFYFIFSFLILIIFSFHRVINILIKHDTKRAIKKINEKKDAIH